MGEIALSLEAVAKGYGDYADTFEHYGATTVAILASRLARSCVPAPSLSWLDVCPTACLHSPSPSSLKGAPHPRPGSVAVSQEFEDAAKRHK